MKLFTLLLGICTLFACSLEKKQSSSDKVKLITLDPGHFHAALIQKSVYPDIDTNVYVYAPEGKDLQDHLTRIESYNNRKENSANWNEMVYTGTDFFEKMLEEKPGNVVVLAGNNRKKTGYIKACVESGLNVLSDKPMAINMTDFQLLKQSFEIADQKGVLLYDIMTERSEITTILQKEFSMDKDLFGELEKGSLEHPAVTKESVHHFYKYVSGSVLVRPAWFFDVLQEGEGIVDVTTHLVDLIQWECFPDQIIDYTKQIEVVRATHWPTTLNPSQFAEVTGLNIYPDYLKKDLKDTLLNVFSNGEINYKIKDVSAKVSVIWNYKAPEGTGDTHFSIMRGTKANLIIRQGKEQNYKPTLYIEPAGKYDEKTSDKALSASVNKIAQKYPGIDVEKQGTSWVVIIPEKYKIGHEEHFAQVTERFLQYLKEGKLPPWEVPNMLAKYYIVATALEMAGEK